MLNYINMESTIVQISTVYRLILYPILGGVVRPMCLGPWTGDPASRAPRLGYRLFSVSVVNSSGTVLVGWMRYISLEFQQFVDARVLLLSCFDCGVGLAVVAHELSHRCLARPPKMGGIY